jgi:ABC-type oligopeptide transport system substrate-binding subunit
MKKAFIFLAMLVVSTLFLAACGPTAASGGDAAYASGGNISYVSGGATEYIAPFVSAGNAN